MAPDEISTGRIIFRVVCVFICLWAFFGIISLSCHSEPSSTAQPSTSTLASTASPNPYYSPRSQPSSPPPETHAQFDDSSNVALDLVKIDTDRDVDENDPKVKEMDAALNAIHDKTGNSNPQIGRVLVYCQNEMQKGGVYQSLIDVAHGLDDSMVGNQKYDLAGLAATYEVLTVQMEKQKNDSDSTSSP